MQLRCKPERQEAGKSNMKSVESLTMDVRQKFEAIYGPMEFDLTRMRTVAPEPWLEYASDATGYAWAGFLAAHSSQQEEIERLKRALMKVISSWDERAVERESHSPHPDLPGGYWTPAASMVDSEAIAFARAALNPISASDAKESL